MNNIETIIEFDEKAHKYKLNGHQFKTSVTEFVHEHFPKFIEDEVINNILKSRKMNDPTYTYFGMDKTQILDKWENNKVLGTIMHEQIEYFYNNNKTSKPNIEFTPEYKYFLNFANDFPNLNAYKTELRIYSLHLDLAGSIDLLVKNDDNTYDIIDWKRSKFIDNSTTPTLYTTYAILPKLSHIMNTNYNHYSFQLNVYKYILENEYGFKIKNMKLVVCHPENKTNNYEIYKVPYMDDEMSYIMKLRKDKINNS